MGLGGAGIVYGLTLLPTALLAAFEADIVPEGMWALIIPGVGPFIATGLLKAEDEGAAILVGCGIVESAGLIMAGIGYWTSEGPRLLRVHTPARLSISPGVAGAPGLSVRMSF